MERTERDAEDLLRDATALTERAELRLTDADDRIIIGFRHDGGASFFFGLDEVYHFNSQASLRRAARDGKLIKAVHGKLASLTRERDGGKVRLKSTDLSVAETQAFKERLSAKLAELLAALKADRYELLRQVPDESPIVRRTMAWIAALPDEVTVAESPHAR